MFIAKTAQEIIAAEVSKEKKIEDKVEESLPKPSKPRPETSVPQVQIDAAMELAGLLREKVSSLLSELDLAMNDLSGGTSPSVLESKDDFKSLVLRLKAMKRKLMVV
jgi:hypothetical protein